MTFWSVFFGVFLGIIAGLAVNLLINAINNYRTEKKMMESLKYEIGFNIERIDEFIKWVKMLNEYAGKDELSDYRYTFNFSKILNTTLKYMFQNRSIYKLVDKETIGKLQNFYSDFQPYVEKKINDAVAEFRKRSDDPKVKKEVDEFVNDYIILGFKAAKDNLYAIKDKLK